MTRRLPTKLAAMIAALATAGCGSNEDPQEQGGVAGPEAVAEEAAPEPRPVRAQVIGEVASVNTKQGFVLIRRTGGRSLPSGVVYSSIAKDGRTASLQLTGERLGKFFAADIRAGDPAAGDLVVARPLPPSSQPELTPAGPAGGANRPAGIPESLQRAR